MSEVITVPLSRLYENGNDDPFEEVKFKAPWRALYVRLGEPFTVLRMEDGSKSETILHGTIDEYMKELCVSPGYDRLGTISIPDARRIEKRFLELFMEGGGGLPTTSPERSADDTDGNEAKP